MPARSPRSSPSWARPAGVAAAAAALAVTLVATAGGSASAATADVGLASVGSYSVLGGQTVTNTVTNTQLAGSVGVSPGSAITNFPPGHTDAETHAGDAEALQAQSDLGLAYDDAAGRASTALVSGDLGTLAPLVPGVYKANDAIGLTGTVTLDGQGNPAAVWIFQLASDFTTASSSVVSLVNDAQPCHVYWQIGSSAVLGTHSSFVGTVMALTSITVGTGTDVEGRMLARNGQVSLDDNTFTNPACGTTSSTPPGSGGGTGVTTPPGGGGGTGVTTPPGGGTGVTTPPGGGGGVTTPPGGGGVTSPAGGGATGPGGVGNGGPNGATGSGGVLNGGNGGGNGNGNGGNNAGGSLASTGPDRLPQLVGGSGVLLAAGVLLVWVSRRRRVAHRH